MSQLNKYEFAITIDNAESGEFIFAIAATDKSSGRTSQINTLNWLLSELGVDEELAEDGPWTADLGMVLEWTKTIAQILDQPMSRQYLEKQLDEDRAAGEWENDRPQN